MTEIWPNKEPEVKRGELRGELIGLGARAGALDFGLGWGLGAGRQSSATEYRLIIGGSPKTDNVR